MWHFLGGAMTQKIIRRCSMPTKKSDETTFLTPGDLKEKTENVDVEKEADKIVQKLNADKGLLDSFQQNGLSVIQNLLPTVRNTGVLNTILQLVLSKLNLGDLLGGIGSLITGKTDEKEEEKEEKPKTSSKKKKKKTSTSGKTSSTSGKKTDGKKKTGKKTEKKDEEKKEEGGILSGIMNLFKRK